MLVWILNLFEKCHAEPFDNRIAKIISCRCQSLGLGWSMDTANFVAVWIQEIAQMHHAHRAAPRAGRIFHADTSVGDGSIVERFHLLW